MANQHFFQPLLPGFHSHLTIPVAFFLKNIQGRYDEQKTTELRSDASKKIWEVNLDGRKLTDGWKEFALSHDLRIGDIVIFRQESDMSFHVTPVGPSCSEIQYGYEESNSVSEKIQEESKKRSREEESSSLDSSCLVANVSPASLQYDLLYLPKRFVRENGIGIESGEIVLMNERGRSWALNLREKQSCGTTYIRRGWRSFCGANGLRAGDSVTFRLSQRGETFVLSSLSSKEPEDEANEVVSLSTEPECDEDNNLGKMQMKENPKREIESSSLDPSCFVANVTPATLRYDRLNLPKRFVRENGLDTRCGEIVLMNEKGRSWTSELKGKESDQVTYIYGGWRSFCGDNGLKAGVMVTFKLIQRGRTLALCFWSSKEPKEEANEVVSISTEPESEEEISIGKIQRKKKPRRETESSSLDPTCFVANVAPSTLRYDILNLPMKFVRVNGIVVGSGKIVLMNEKGRSWTLKLRQKPSCGTTYIRRGWRSFCHANGLKAGSFFTFKLIQKGRTQVLRLSRNEPEEEEEVCSESNEVESLSTEPESDGESSQEERKISQECSISKGKPSSSSSQDRFVTLTLRPYNINRSVLRLPSPFRKKNGINEETKMTMLDKHGVKWPVKLRFENDNRIRVGGSWKDFLKANCVKTNESIKLELIWEKDSSCVLKFCSKVKLLTK
ncbi:putative B3 domain-containing protein REM15 [Cardamine amara subsp. amara]|uniref:B3 domain-containing protein REM15 n=1 Tax=Cardamine amara subsp. amara TaxID=228776 RepID=A0ABD1BWF3_CARAN